MLFVRARPLLADTCLRRDERAIVKRTANSAYPKVVSNLGSLADLPKTRVAINMIRFMNHYARTIRERAKIIEFFRSDRYMVATRQVGGAAVPLPNMEAFQNIDGLGSMGTKALLGMMQDYFAVGYANTLGFAHANSGDTMTSVMIGGLRTVQNGDFEIFPGDLVQFYWSFERDDFEQDGRRKEYIDIWNGETPGNVDPSAKETGPSRKRDASGQLVSSWQVPADASIRQAHYNLSYGQRADRMKIVAKIKPYFRDDRNPRLMDWYRVFGIAIASARPNEMCDIKISRQSM